MRFFLCLIAAAALFGGQRCDILFYLQDAGETFGLLPVAEELVARGADVQIVAAGTAEGLLAKEGKSFHCMEPAIDAKWPRAAQLSDEAVDTFLERFEPKTFVSGVAFEAQGQLYQAFQKRGVKTIAFWDNFNPDGEDLYFKTARKVQAMAEHLWVPSQRVAESFPARTHLFISGQPSLERWIAEAKRVDVETIRSRLLRAGQKLAVFIGGYGPQYEEAFELLIASLDAMDPRELFVLVQPHPKYGGSIETEILARRTSNRILSLHVMQGEISTIEAVSASDIVLCHQSTVGFQALFLGKPVIHLIPPGQTFTSLPLEQGWSLKAASAEECKSALGKAASGTPDLWTEMGLPADSCKRCADRLFL